MRAKGTVDSIIGKSLMNTVRTLTQIFLETGVDETYICRRIVVNLRTIADALEKSWINGSSDIKTVSEIDQIVQLSYDFHSKDVDIS